MAVSRSNRIDSCEDNWSDSDSYSSDDDSTKTLSKTTIPHNRRDETCPLADNPNLLYDLSGRISTVWKQVGRYLQIKECIIENIEIEYEREDTREKAYQLLLTWSRQHGSNATLHDLLNVLVYIGRSDIANAISVSCKQQRPFVGSERAVKLEKKSHIKLQKQVLRKLKDALQFYQERLREVEDLQHRVFEEREAQEMKEKLQELDKDTIQRKLDSLQEQIDSMQEKDQKYWELDQQLRIVADKLYDLDKTFKKFNDALELLDDLRVSYYSQIECTFVGLCHFRRTKFPRLSSSGKHSRISSKGDEELEDDVFQDYPGQNSREHSESTTSSKLGLTRNTLSRSSLSKLFRHTPTRNKTSPRTHPHRAQEEHTNRKLSVSMTDSDEQFQLEDFMAKFCRRYRHDRPFVYSHCCMNSPRPLYSIDPNTLPVPRYQSTETIISLVTSPCGTHTSRGFVNVTSDWI